MFDSESHPGARSYRDAHLLPTQRMREPRPSNRRVIRQGILVAAVTILALLWAAIWFHLGTVRASDIVKAENTARNLDRTLEEHMLRTLTAIDQVLIRMRALYASHPGPYDFVAAMPEAQGVLEMAVGAYLAGPDGRVIWSSTDTGQGSYVGDREHFTVQAKAHEDKVYISRPVIGRVSGKPSIQVTRRITLPDGSFGGIVDVALDPSYLDGFYQSIDLGPHGTTTVFGLDGIVRARSAHEPTSIGQHMPNSPVMRAQRDQPEGLIRIDSVFDGLPKLVAFRRLEAFPILVTVAVSEADALADFIQQRRAVVSAGFLISALIAGFAIALVRQLAHIDRASSALAASEERYHLLIDGSREGMYDRDFSSGTTWFSERAHQILGLADGVLNGDRSKLLALIHPVDLLGYEDDIANLLAEHDSHISTLFRMQHVDGTWRWIETRGRVVYATDGSPRRSVGSFGDVTDGKTAEAALLESHNHLVEAERLGRLGSIAFDQADDRAYWSDSLFELRRVPKRDSFTCEQTLGFIHPDDLCVYLEARNAGIAEHRNFEVDTRGIRPDGTIAWEHTIGHPRFDDAGNFIGLLLVIRDITDIRQAELALRRSEERYALVVDGMREGLFDRDFKSNTAWFSSRLHEILGLPDGTLNGDREIFASLIHPDDRTQYEADVRRREAERCTHNVANFRMRHADGAWRWIVLRGSALYDESGAMIRAVGSIGDNTAQKLSEQALRESEARFRAMIENSADVYYIVRPTGEVLYRSPSTSKVFGYADSDVVDRSIFVGLHPDDVAPVTAALRPRGAGSPESSQGTARLRHKDGSWRHVSWACSDATDIPGINGMVLNVRDVTDAVTMEAQLRQAQKMEAVGRLAGGIAHDFNNILGAILGFSGLLVEDLPSGTPQRDFAQRIAKASDRGKLLVQQILAFSRHTNVDREPIDLGQVVHEIRELLASSMPSTTQLDILVRDEGLVAEANIGQITQILLNLCINANDALASSPGSISLELAGVHPGDADYATFRGDHAENNSAAHAVRTSWGSLRSDRAYARISVADTGLGMDAELLTRIFDPFFTTKGPGRGTGLGLSVVHGIVLSYDGAGLAVSRLGAGTVFTIYLPLIEAEPRKLKSSRTMRSGGGNILFVDDDRNLADATTIGLERLGYKVVTANDPNEAISIFEEAPDRWAAVVSDQTMPGMTGLALFTHLKAIHPRLRFILCTGFSDGSVEREAQAAGIDTVFIKPLSVLNLGARIREIINETSDAAAATAA